MKITKNQLRKIIKEEIEALKEVNLLKIIPTISREGGDRRDAILLTLKFISELESMVDDNDAWSKVSDFKDMLKDALRQMRNQRSQK